MNLKTVPNIDRPHGLGLNSPRFTPWGFLENLGTVDQGEELPQVLIVEWVPDEGVQARVGLPGAQWQHQPHDEPARWTRSKVVSKVFAQKSHHLRCGSGMLN